MSVVIPSRNTVDEALVNVMQRPGSLSGDRSRRHRDRAAILENPLRVLPDLGRAG